MVAYVTGRKAATAGQPGMMGPLAAVALKTAAAIPWEAVFAGGSLLGSGAVKTAQRGSSDSVRPMRGPGKDAKTTSKAPATPRKWTAGPGCQAADNALLTLGYLQGLSRGNNGFGVLAMGKDRLEEGAKGASTAGKPELAAQMRQVAATLPEVHDKKTAREAAKALKPLADEAWELARVCKGSQDKAAQRPNPHQLPSVATTEEPLSMAKWAKAKRTDDLCNACAVPSAAEFYMAELEQVGRQDLAQELSDLNASNKGDGLKLAKALDKIKSRVPQISDSLKAIDLEVQRSMRE